METIKQEVLQTIEKMPDTATMEEIMYRLYVMEKISRGQDAVRNGNVVSVEDLKNEMRQW